MGETECAQYVSGWFEETQVTGKTETQQAQGEHANAAQKGAVHSLEIVQD